MRLVQEWLHFFGSGLSCLLSGNVLSLPKHSVRAEVGRHDCYDLCSTRMSCAIIESVDFICRDSADTQYMLIQTNFSKSPKQVTYKPL